jgi:hypothetical protein
MTGPDDPVFPVSMAVVVSVAVADDFVVEIKVAPPDHDMIAVAAACYDASTAESTLHNAASLSVVACPAASLISVVVCSSCSTSPSPSAVESATKLLNFSIEDTDREKKPFPRITCCDDIARNLITRATPLKAGAGAHSTKYFN